MNETGPNDRNTADRAVLDLSGATCGSCVYTIEHVGKKIRGVNDIHVDVTTGKIYLEYEGGEETVDSVVGIVRRLGYDAKLHR